MKEAPKASQSRIPRLILQNPKDFSASFPESFHAFDNNHTTIRSHPPSFPFPPSAHRPIFPKPKAQSLPAPFRTKCIFPPWYPRKPRFFSPQTSGFCTKCTITPPAKGENIGLNSSKGRLTRQPSPITLPAMYRQTLDKKGIIFFLLTLICNITRMSACNYGYKTRSYYAESIIAGYDGPSFYRPDRRLRSDAVRILQKSYHTRRTKYGKRLQTAGGRLGSLLDGG